VASGTPATALLTKAGISFTLHTYDHDPRAEAFGDEAVAALGLDPARVFKTLIAAIDGKLVCAVVPVAGRLDLKALGGISPLGQRSRLPVVVDASATGFASVFVSAGKRGLQVELQPDDLVAAARATVAPIAAPR
jgi:Cys-tRNA(Pro)/Cys-tRNA(Cys) deacylase